MANKSKLQIVIEVDDKGSIKIRRLGKEAEKAGERGAKGFGKMRRSLSDLDGSAKVSLGTLKNIGLAATAMTAAMVAGITAIMVKAVNAASDLHETTGKFLVVFAGMTKQAYAWSRKLVESYAMSTNEARQYLAAVQDMLVPMGMAADSAGKMSNQVVQLAADLGSFNNLPTAQVMMDIQSALVGNFETMKKYGDVLTSTTVAQKALDMGLAKNVKSLTAGMRAQAAFQMILHGSSAAIGDMARTANGYANRMKKFHSIITNLFAGLGDRLLPLAARGIGQINFELGGTTDQVDALSKALAERLLGSLGSVLEVMRFFHNGWLGLKLVAAATIDFIAMSLDGLFKLLRKLLVPLDLIYQGMVKLGVINVNPFDKISSSLADFAWSSHSVTKDVLRDIDKTNAGYDKIKRAVAGYKKELLSTNKIVLAAVSSSKQQTSAVKMTSAAYKAMIKSIANTGKKIGVEIPAWMARTDALTKRIIEDQSILKTKTSATAQYIEDRWKQAYDGIQSSLADWIYNWKISFDSIVDMFKRMLAEMVAAWLMSKAKMAIGGWLSGMGGLLGDFGSFLMGGKSGGVGSMAGGALSLAGMGSSLASGGSAIAGALGIGGGATVAPYIAGAGQALGSVAVGSTGTTVVAQSGSTVVVSSGATATGASTSGASGAAGASTGSLSSIAAGGAVAAVWIALGHLLTQTSPKKYRAFAVPGGGAWQTVEHEDGHSAHFDALQGMADQSKFAALGFQKITASIEKFRAGVSVLTSTFHDNFGELYHDVDMGNVTFASLAETMAAASGTMINVTHNQEDAMRSLASQAAGGSIDALKSLQSMLVGLGSTADNAAVASMAMVSSMARIPGVSAWISASALNSATNLNIFGRAISQTGRAANDIQYYKPVNMPVSAHADGGVFAAPVHLFGEAGPEAVVPLHAGPDTLRKMDAKLDALAARPVEIRIESTTTLDGEVLDRHTERITHRVIEDRDRSGVSRVLL